MGMPGYWLFIVVISKHAVLDWKHLNYLSFCLHGNEFDIDENFLDTASVEVSQGEVAFA